MDNNNKNINILFKNFIFLISRAVADRKVIYIVNTT
jgi:hypothetical protein